MNAARLLAVAAFATSLGCAQPRTPQSQADDADAGELTCDEKARVAVLCTTALRQRCDSQAGQCDLGCGAPGGAMPPTPADPAENAPEILDMKITQCRDNCRHGRDGCVATIAQRCPVPCQ
jgi:hypothetical protein